MRDPTPHTPALGFGQAHPVPFADHQSSLRWGGVGAEQIWFNATEVSEGTLPKGSTWRRGPIPRAPWGWAGSGGVFLAWG